VYICYFGNCYFPRWMQCSSSQSVKLRPMDSACGKFKKKTNSVFDCIDGSPCPCGMICVVQARSSGVSEKTGSGNDVTGNRRSGSNAGSGRDTFSCVHKYRWNSYANTAVILSRQPVDLYRQSVFLYSWNTDVINVLCEKQSKNVFINVLIFPRFY